LCGAGHLENPEEMAIEKTCLASPLEILYLPLSSVLIGGYIFLLRNFGSASLDTFGRQYHLSRRYMLNLLEIHYTTINL
jgi:hypothetical protein